jgi:hypothetical protein
MKCSARAGAAAFRDDSRLYREKLADAGFATAKAVSGLEDIAQPPFTEKDELRAAQTAAEQTEAGRLVGGGIAAAAETSPVGRRCLRSGRKRACGGEEACSAPPP